MALWVIAAGLTVSAAALGWGAGLQAQKAALEPRAEDYDRIVRVLASRELRTRELLPPLPGTSAHGVLYLDPASGAGMVAVHHLPPPAPGGAWQLWFVRGTERISGGVLQVDGSGSGYALVRVPADLAAYEVAGITDEPRLVGGPAASPPWAISARL